MRTVWVEVKTETTIEISLVLTLDEARAMVLQPNNNSVFPAFVKMVSKILTEDERIPACPDGPQSGG